MTLAHDLNKGTRTQDVRITQDITFSSMFLSTPTIAGLNSSGFHIPSPIQLHGIPLGKCGFDLLLEAKSGTGKTAVFTIIALEQLNLEKGLQTLILAPTREIAAQVCDVMRLIGSNYEGLKVAVVMGGMPLQEDIAKFKNKDVHIVVGSPGRLKHLIHDKVIDVTAVRLLVLDEADKLVEKSFIKEINYIFSSLPKQKQVIMSSATYPEDTKTFIKQFVQNAQHICPESNCVLRGVDQKMTLVKYNSNVVKQTQHRFKELLKILSRKQFKQCLIFCNYQTRVGELHKMLTKEKWPAEQLYGKQEQSERLDALKTLQEYKCRILISTDLAARGIDASNVDLVINFEPPTEWQTYLHRIGRAGRFGSYGIAVSVVSEGKEEKHFKGILDFLNIQINDFWNEKPLSNSSSFESKKKVFSTQTLSNNEEEVNFNDLWDLLITSRKLPQIEDFTTLCKSYENSDNTTVYSFSDLLCSFESHNTDSQTSPEKGSINAFKENIMKVKQCFSHKKSKNLLNYKTFDVDNNKCSTKDKTNDIPVLNNCHHNGYKALELESDMNDNTNEYNDLENNKICSKSVTSKFSNRNVYTNKNNGFINHKINRNHKNNYDIEDSEEYDMTQALRNAGLPTAFGKQQSKHKIKYNNRYKVKPDYFNGKAGISRDEQQSKKGSNIERNRNHYIINISQSSQDENVSTYERGESDSSDDDSEFEYSEQNKKQTKSHNCFSSYNEWYRQLKLVTSHIEYITYIEEMSKLNY